MRQLLRIAFVLSGLSGCSSATVAPDAGYCPPGQAKYMPELCGLNNDPCNIGNSLHIGAWCTYQGNQCAQYNLICGIDVDPVEGENFCLTTCSHDSECGENACCSGDPKNLHPQDQHACVPTSCPNPVCDGG